MTISKEESIRLKNKLQLYGNIERLTVMNNKIKKNATLSNENEINEVVAAIIKYQETLVKIVTAFEDIIISDRIDTSELS